METQCLKKMAWVRWLEERAVGRPVPEAQGIKLKRTKHGKRASIYQSTAGTRRKIPREERFLKVNRNERTSEPLPCYAHEKTTSAGKRSHLCFGSNNDTKVGCKLPSAQRGGFEKTWQRNTPHRFPLRKTGRPQKASKKNF